MGENTTFVPFLVHTNSNRVPVKMLNFPPPPLFFFWTLKHILSSKCFIDARMWVMVNITGCFFVPL